MVKIQKISNTSTPFGGIFLVNEIFEQCGLSELIDKELGKRNSNLGYTYSNLIRNFFNLILSGGECVEDIHQHFRPTLEQIPDNKVASPDTFLRLFNELAVKNTIYTSSYGNSYNFNTNKKLNDLNIKLLLLTGQLEKGKFYNFDYDNQILEHEKCDAKKTYKRNTGYLPGISNIGNKVAFVVNRDGNANVKIGQAETLEYMYETLISNEIYVDSSRMDAGSYSKEIVDTVAKYSKSFYIRANKSGQLINTISQIEADQWKKIEIKSIEYEVTSIPFTNFYEERNYRLVVSRKKADNPQLDLFEGEYIYRCILTNDWEKSEKEIIEYYNQRGTCEKLFDVMNNDFCWKYLPTSNMPANTSFLILTAMIKNFYNYIVQKVSKVFKDILPTTRLKRFIFRFIAVVGRYVYRGRQWKIQLYTERPYELISCQ